MGDGEHASGAETWQALKALPVGLALLALLLEPGASAADEAKGKQVLEDIVPAEFAQAPLVSKLRDDAVLHLAIGLPVKDPSRLKTELNELYDPNSPQFHEFLSPERFAQQYGASEKDYQSLIAFARANGLRVTATYPDHLLLAVDGSAASINKTFHISLANRRRPDGANSIRRIASRRSTSAPRSWTSADSTISSCPSAQALEVRVRAELSGGAIFATRTRPAFR
jgi:hypothetical protein